MVTVEVNLKEDDKPPEQHLDEGEFIERVTVPLDQLYDKLKGTLFQFMCLNLYEQIVMSDSSVRRKGKDS